MTVNDGYRRRWLIAGYVILLAAAFGAFLVVCVLGRDVSARVAPAASTALANVKAAAPNVLPRVLLALAIILLVSRMASWLFARIGQPQVIGEVVAGICLGPSLLGHLAPDAAGFLFPPFVVQPLGMIAQVGVVLFLFLVGLELDTSVLRKQTRPSIVVAHASIVVPFVLGSTIALWVYPRFSTSDVSFDVFAMFMGVSMSVTAFPVLARILTDRGMQRTRVGVIALACAAVDDVTAWCLLAAVVGFASGHGGSALLTVILTGLYLTAMLLVVRPIISRITQKLELVPKLDKGAVALMFIALLLSALLTEWIGIHALFGAFTLGAIVPHDSRLARELAGKLEDVTVLLFLPAFFAYTGLRTEISLVDGASAWLVCGGLIVVACAGKFGGSMVAGRLVGMTWLDAAQVGILMNTRGLMQLVVLTVGLDLGVLSPQLFTMLVIMAVVATVMTAPALTLLERRSQVADRAAPSQTARA